MVKEIKEAAPVIDFGFGLNTIAVEPGQPVTVWQNTLYADGYEGVLYAMDASFEKVNEYRYNVEYVEPGEYEVYLQVSNPEKTKTFVSNTITVKVE